MLGLYDISQHEFDSKAAAGVIIICNMQSKTEFVQDFCQRYEIQLQHVAYHDVNEDK